MIGNLKEWVNHNVCFMDDNKYWAALKSIISPYSMWGKNYTQKIQEEIEMYIDSKNDHVLSNEAIDFIKNDAYITFKQFA
jgi:hypothetical protein